MIKLHTQQGDCLLELVTNIPATAKKMDMGEKLIVLQGEGVNTHEIVDTDSIEAYTDGETLYLKTSSPVDIIHQEHGKTTLAPQKIYRRIIEREWDYESEEARKTQD